MNLILYFVTFVVQIQFLHSHTLTNQTTTNNIATGGKSSTNGNSSSTFFSLADAFNSASQGQPNVPAATDPFLNYIHSLVQLVDTFPGKETIHSTAVPFKYEEPVNNKTKNSTENGFTPTLSIQMESSPNGSTPTPISNVKTVPLDSHIAIKAHNSSGFTYDIVQNDKPNDGLNRTTSAPITTTGTFETKQLQLNATKPIEVSNSTVPTATTIPVSNITEATSVTKQNITNVSIPITKTTTTTTKATTTATATTTEAPTTIVALSQTTASNQNDLFALLGLDKGRMDNLPSTQEAETTTPSQYIQQQAVTYSPFLRPSKRGRNSQKINVHVVPVQQIVKTTDLSGNGFDSTFREHVAKVNKGYDLPVLSEFVDKSHTSRQMVGRVNVRPVHADRLHDPNAMFISTSIDPFVRIHNEERNTKIGYNVDTFGQPHHQQHHSEIRFMSLDNTVTRPTIVDVTINTSTIKNNVTISNGTMEVMVNGTNKNKTLPFWLSLLNTNNKGIIRGKDGFVSYIGKSDAHPHEIVSNESLHNVDTLPPGLTMLSAGRQKRIKDSKKDTKTTLENHNDNSGLNYSLPETFMAGTSFNVVHTPRKEQRVHHMFHNRHSNEHVGRKTKHNSNLKAETPISTPLPGENNSTTSWVPQVNSTIRWNLFVGTPDTITRKHNMNHSEGHSMHGDGSRRNLFPPATHENHTSSQENRTSLFPPKPNHGSHNSHASHGSNRNKLFPPSAPENNLHDKHTSGHGSGQGQGHSQMHNTGSDLSSMSFMHPQSRLTSHPQNGNRRQIWHHTGHSAARPLPEAKRNLWQSAHSGHGQHKTTQDKPSETVQHHSSHITGKSNNHGSHSSGSTTGQANHHNMHSGNGHRIRMSNLQIHNQHPQSRNRLFEHDQTTQSSMFTVMHHGGHGGHDISVNPSTMSAYLETSTQAKPSTQTTIFQQGPTTERPSSIQTTESTSVTASNSTTASVNPKLMILKNNTLVKALKERYYKEIMKRLLLRRLLQRQALVKARKNATSNNTSNASSTTVTTELPSTTVIHESTDISTKIREQTTEIFELLHGLVMQKNTTPTELPSEPTTTIMPEILSTENVFNVDILTTESSTAPLFDLESSFVTDVVETTTIPEMTTADTTLTTSPTPSYIHKVTTAVSLNHPAHEPEHQNTLPVVQESNVTVNLTQEGVHRLMKTLSLIRALKRANLVTEHKNSHLITVNIAALRKAYAKLKMLRDRRNNQADHGSNAVTSDPIHAQSNTNGNNVSERQVTMSALGINSADKSKAASLTEAGNLRPVIKTPTNNAEIVLGRVDSHSNVPVNTGSTSQAKILDVPIPTLREAVQLVPNDGKFNHQNDISYQHSANNNGVVSRKPISARAHPKQTETFTIDQFADLFASVATSNEISNSKSPAYKNINGNQRQPIVAQSNIRPTIPKKNQIKDQLASGNPRPIQQRPSIQNNQINDIATKKIQPHIDPSSNTITINGPGNKKFVFVKKQPLTNQKKVTQPPPQQSVKLPHRVDSNNQNTRQNHRNNTKSIQNSYGASQMHSNRRNNQRQNQRPNRRFPINARKSFKGDMMNRGRGFGQSTHRQQIRNNPHRNQGRRGPQRGGHGNINRQQFPKSNLPDKNRRNNINIRRILSRLFHGLDYGGPNNFYHSNALRNNRLNNFRNPNFNKKPLTVAERREQANERMEALEEALEAGDITMAEYNRQLNHNVYKRSTSNSNNDRLLYKRIQNYVRKSV